MGRDYFSAEEGCMPMNTVLPSGNVSAAPIDEPCPSTNATKKSALELMKNGKDPASVLEVPPIALVGKDLLIRTSDNVSSFGGEMSIFACGMCKTKDGSVEVSFQLKEEKSQQTNRKVAGSLTQTKVFVPVKSSKSTNQRVLENFGDPKLRLVRRQLV